VLHAYPTLGVVPVLIGPLQALVAMLPALLVALGGAIVSLFRPNTVRNLARLLWHQKIAVICLVAVGIATHRAWRLVPSSGAGAPLEESGQAWPMMRGGPDRTGMAAAARDPLGGGVNWAFTRDTATFHATPAVIGNRVYVSSVADISPFRRVGRGAIYCLDADSGAVVWRSAPAGYRATYSSPAISGRHLVCGEGLHLVTDARIVCLDIEDQGRLLWEHRTASHVESSPCIFQGRDGQGRVCIGAGDDGYYCLALEPDADGNARVLWHTGSENYEDAETSPVVVPVEFTTESGTTETRPAMFAGLGVGGTAVICLDAETGREMWRQETPYPAFSAPAVARRDGQPLVMVGMGNGNVIETAEDVAQKEIDKLKARGAPDGEIERERERLRPGGAVWCMSAADGGVLWKIALPRTVLGTVIPADEGIYFACRDGRLYRAPHDGRSDGLLSFDTHEPVSTSPALGNEHVYVLTDSGRLIAVSRRDLTVSWETRAGTSGRFLSSPTLARGHVYLGSEAYGLLCLGQEGRREPPAWRGFMGGPGQPGHTDPGPLPSRASYAWHFPPADERGPEAPAAATAEDGGLQNQPLANGNEVESAVLRRSQWIVTAPAAHTAGRLYAPIAAGPHAGLVCFATGGESGPKPAWSYTAPAGVHGSPVVCPRPSTTGEALVFAVEGKPGNNGRQLACLESSTGNVLWKKPLADSSGGNLVLHNGHLFLDERPGTLVCRDLDGGVAREINTGTLSGPVFLQDSLLVAATRGPAGLSVFDWPTQKELWRVALERGAVTGPVIRDQRIYVGDEDGVSAFSLFDGSCLHRGTTGAPATRLAIGASGLLAYVSSDQRLVVLDVRTDEAPARVVTATEPADPRVPPVICHEGILFKGEKDLMLFDADERTAARWMSSAWLGEPTAAAIVANSRVYFGTSERGLVCAKGRE